MMPDVIISGAKSYLRDDEFAEKYQWSRATNLPKKLAPHFKFYISTNTIDVSVQCARRVSRSNRDHTIQNEDVNVAQQPSLRVAEYTRIIGVDPGASAYLAGVVHDVMERLRQIKMISP